MMGQKPGMDSDAFNREAETGMSLSSRPLGLESSSQDYLVTLSLKKKTPYQNLS